MKNQSDDRHYQLVLLTPHDRTTFSHYVEEVTPVAARYGAGLERQFKPESVHAEGIDLPSVVNLVYYASSKAYAEFCRDPEFREVLPLRQRSAQVISVEGPTTHHAAAPGEAARRLYLIEIARFGSCGASAYHAYEQEAEAVMARHGYHVERVLSPTSWSELPFEPDLVKIAYFDTPEALERVHADPAHQRIEHELYPAAASQSIWIVARTTGP